MLMIYVVCHQSSKTEITKDSASETSNEITEMINSKTFSGFKIPDLRCHIQSVKRHIKLVSEASSLVCDHASRKGLIRNKLASKSDDVML